MNSNAITDRLPGDLRFMLTGNYRTRAEIAEFEAGHGAGYSVWRDGDNLVWFGSENGPPRWTAHGWCAKCQALLAALPPVDEYVRGAAL